MKKLLALIVLLTTSQIIFSQVIVDATFLTNYTSVGISALQEDRLMHHMM